MKKILVLLFFSVFIYATSAFDIASNLVADSSKEEKLRLLFPEGSYMQGNKPNIKEITRVLKMNALLKPGSNNVLNRNIKFIAKAKAGIFLKAIMQAYEQIGVKYFLVSEYEKNNDEISVSFNISSKNSIDPGTLHDIFQKMGIKIVDLKKENINYIYRLDFSNAKINTQFTLNKGGELELLKPLESYFIKVNSVSKIFIDIGYNNLWYPKIEFLDKNLNLIDTYTNENNTKTINLALPSFCEYILIGDKYTLQHIKLGLKIKAQ